MAIERAQYGGADQQPPSSLSPKSSEIATPLQAIIQAIEELTPMALDALDSDKAFPAWAGGQNWREEGLKHSLLGGSPRFKGMDISYFGTVPQNGPALFLKVREHHGEGFFFQLGHSDSHNEGGKLDMFLYWDETGRVHDLTKLEPAERAEKIEKTRKYIQRLKESLATKEA